MSKLKKLYHQYIYGVMGTLVLHIFIVAGFLVAELRLEVETAPEEAILLDFTAEEEKIDLEKPEEEFQQSDKSPARSDNTASNRAVNDAQKNLPQKDRFFDANYEREIEEAKKMVADVNKQLSKKVQPVKKYEMPEATTEGQNPDSIRNVVYSGKSNIHYNLENRFHVRLPIPVYLAKSGGEITVDILVDRSGKVVKAEVRPTKATQDPMLPVYAGQAAERTLFNADSKAPSIQKGTITYKFVAQ